MALFKILVWAIIFLTKSILIVRIVVFLSNHKVNPNVKHIYLHLYINIASLSRSLKNPVSIRPYYK